LFGGRKRGQTRCDDSWLERDISLAPSYKPFHDVVSKLVRFSLLYTLANSGRPIV
jgi:hypothetical protein